MPDHVPTRTNIYSSHYSQLTQELKGHRIRYIENLGVAKDPECIDFTDNEITILENFPSSPRLHTLLFAGNRISKIKPSLAPSAPNVHTIVLTRNNLQELADLSPLQGFKSLQHLTLVGNPVVRKENYRLWLLWHCPTLRFLDFQKVKDAERTRARELFGTRDEPTELARGLLAARGGDAPKGMATDEMNGGVNGEAGSTTLTEAQRKRLQALIREAKTLAEVQRYEVMLKKGRLPAGMGEDEEMGGT